MCLYTLSFKSLTTNLFRVLFIIVFLPIGCHKMDGTKADVKQVVIKDKNGLPQEIYTLKESVLHGYRILFFPGSKDTSVFETHENGRFNGAYRSFYLKNKLKLKGQYLNDEMVGLWYKYDERGFLIEEVTFSKNKENGPFNEFFPSGQLSVSGNYKNGNTEDGPLLFYNEEGKLVKKMICSGGICRTQWKDNQSTQ